MRTPLDITNAPQLLDDFGSDPPIGRALRACRTTLRQSMATAVVSGTGYLGENPLVVLDYLLRVARVAILLTLWRTIYAAHAASTPVSASMPLHALLTYTLIAEVFADQLACRTTLDDAVWSGTIIVKFLTPMSTAMQFAAEMAGRWMVNFTLCSLPLLLLAPLFGIDPRPANGAAGFFFVVSLTLAIANGLAQEFIFGAGQIMLDLPVWLVGTLRTALIALLSGAVIPLALFPAGAGELFQWLPFASMASAPLRIYTATGDAVPLLLVQAGWVAALCPVAVWSWRSCREKLVGYEG